MSGNAQKVPILISDESNLEIEKVLFTSAEFDEGWMQQLIHDNPKILPVAEINPIFYPLVPIGKEAGTPAGPIDNLYISPTGHVTIVETKLWRNQESRRKVFAQIIDYAKELKGMSYDDIDNLFKKYNLKYHNKDTGLFEMMVENGYLTDHQQSYFVDSVQKNLNNAKFLLLIVGDGIREEVKKMADFFMANPVMDYTLALLELEVYKIINQETKKDQGRLVVPNLLMKTTNIERGVFRIVKGDIVYEDTVVEEVIEKATGTWTKVENEEVFIDDFIKELKFNNPEIQDLDVEAFFEDLESLNFVIQPLKSSRNIVVKYTIPQSQKKIDIIFISRNKGEGIYKLQNSFERDLINNGFSGEIAKDFYKDMYQYQDDNLGKATHINHSLFKVLNNKNDVLEILERLKAKLD